MGAAYLFALVVGVGILTIQAILGSKDADGGADKDFGKDLHFDAEADVEADADADADGDAEAGADQDSLIGGPADLVALFLSVRFWVFASLGFGLSGTLLTFLTGVGAIPTAVTAISLGLFSGLAAALTFRFLRRTASATTEDHRIAAIGRVGRVLLPVQEGSRGKVRIEIGGRNVDLIAKTNGLRIERGDTVIVEDVEDDTALVVRAPDELQ